MYIIYIYNIYIYIYTNIYIYIYINICETSKNVVFSCFTHLINKH